MIIPAYILPILFVIVVFLDALTDIIKIRENEKINHKFGALIYFIISLVAGIVFWAWSTATWADIILFPLITRLAFFDPLLNLLLKKPFIYEGVHKPKEDSSFTDLIEKKTGISVLWLRLIYIILFIGYLIFSLCFQTVT